MAEQLGADARIAALEAALADSNARLAERDAKLTELVDQIAKLVAQVEKLNEQVRQNSKNSHRPPSSDGPGADSGGGSSNKPKSDRKRGGQKGHRGSHRELVPSELVDAFIDIFPGVCLGCACELPRTLDADARRHQQLDLRDHRPYLTEFRRHEVECSKCGVLTRAAYSRGQIPSSAFGPCLTAVVGMLTGVYHLSRRKAQQLLSELFGISISLGAISAMEGRASEALKSAHAEAKREVEYAGVKHTGV